jgi:hypothetical protein
VLGFYGLEMVAITNNRRRLRARALVVYPGSD